MRFIDSVLFFQQPLKNLPGMFNLNNLYGITSKGYFPHRFNTPENYDYIGPMPDMKFYEVERMKTNDNCKSKNYNDLCNIKKCERCNFIKWYNEQINNNYIFNFQDETKKYCEMDVDILLWSVVEFRNIILSTEY